MHNIVSPRNDEDDYSFQSFGNCCQSRLHFYLKCTGEYQALLVTSEEESLSDCSTMQNEACQAGSYTLTTLLLKV